MGKVTDQQLVQVAEGAGWRGDDLTTAVAVALAESGGNPAAVNRANSNGSVDYGLWQVNSVHSGGNAPEGWGDPATNAKLAHAVWAGRPGGWGAWSAYKSGAYLLFMPRARVATTRYASGLGSGVVGPSVGDVAGGIGDAAGSARDAVQLAARAGSWSSQPGNWLRVVYVVLGGVLVAGAVIVLAGRSVPAAGVLGAARKVLR